MRSGEIDIETQKSTDPNVRIVPKPPMERVEGQAPRCPDGEGAMVIDNLDAVGRADSGAVAAALDRAARSPGNDNGVAGGIEDTTALAADPSIAKVVKGTLRKYGRTEAQLEEDVAEVVTRAIEAARRGPMPKSLGAWKALATTIAPRYAIRARRAAGTRRRRGGELCGEPDLYGPLEFETPRDPVDAKRFLAVLKELFDAGKMPDKGAEILWGVAEGVTQREIAEETGLTDDQVDTRLRRMRRKFRLRIEELGMVEKKDAGEATENRPVGDLPR